MKTAYGATKKSLLANGLKTKGTMGDIAKTFGASLWDAANKSYVPDFVMKGLAISPALAARQEALGAFKRSKSFSRHHVTWKQSSVMLFRRYIFNDKEFKKELITNGPTSVLDGVEMARAYGHLSSSWQTGSWKDNEPVQRVAPAVNTWESAKGMYEEYQKRKAELDQAEKVYKKMEAVAASYLEEIVFVRKYDDKQKWQKKAEDLQHQLGQDTHIVVDERGIAVQLNFQFNSSHLENEVQPLRSDCSDVCENLRELLEANPYYQVVIEGHAGVIGSE